MLKKEYLNIPYSFSPTIIHKHFDRLALTVHSLCTKKEKKIIIYGMGANGFNLASELSKHKEYNIIAYIDRANNLKINGKVVIKPDQLKEIKNIDLIIVTTAPNHYTDINNEISKCINDVKILYLYSSGLNPLPDKSLPADQINLNYQLNILESNINEGNYYSVNLMLRTLLHRHPDNKKLINLNKKIEQLVIGKNLDNDQLIGSCPCPNTTNIQIIDNCNLKCFMCFRQDPNFQPMTYFKKPITREVFHGIIDTVDLKNTATVLLGGSGEAFMHPDILYFLDYITNHGCRVHFITNGTMLSSKLAEELAGRSLFNLELSLDAFSKKTYESIRIGANFKKVISQFKYFVKMVRQNKSDINLSITSILMKRTIEEFPLIIEFASELGITTVNGNHLVMSGNAVDYPEESLIFHPLLFNNVIKQCQDLAEKKGVTLNAPALFELDKKNDNSCKSKSCSAKPWQICHEPWTKLDMGHQGFSICCGGHPGLNFTDDFLTMGDKKPFNFKYLTGYDSFEKLYNCETLRRLRKQLLTNNPSDYCKKCLQQSYNQNNFSFNSVFSKQLINSERYAQALGIFTEKFKDTPYLKKMLQIDEH